MLRASHLRAWAERYGTCHDPTSPELSPGLRRLYGVRHVFIHLSRGEILAPDIHRLVERARAAGVLVEHRSYGHVWHDFHIQANLVEPASVAVVELGSFLATGLDRRNPSACTAPSGGDRRDRRQL
ncbi:alpha/beta hydrolase fold domain-containing protein [Actinomadura sp. LCR2-06]|uniref:Alpha/beta hydrolase fold domain-containing protein n=1 Tax=Actinomadura violacea TaxID=2819934 RepID=A0ABS3S8Q7_9ACTN|nr:alpha/beta hydrolase fold domain-containing protein [Actinomadura violacea]